jgi:hypothetical protein
VSEAAALRPEDQDLLNELIGKYVFDAGMSRIEAEDRALREILEERKEKAGEKKDPFRFLRIGDLELRPPHWLVKHLIETDGFGEPGCGKSFLAIEISCRVVTGTPFFGFEVKHPGPVYYLAAEGRGGLIRRFRAWSIARGVSLEGVPLYLNETPLTLIDELSCRNAITALRKKADELKVPPGLIVVDTWSRNLGGDDSSPQDAAVGVAALDQIRGQFQNVACLVIHHSGQSMKDRSRGWSGLRAAVDFEFRMERGSDDFLRLT